MKKLLLLLLISATSTAATQAQVTLLPKVGLNVSKVYFDDDEPFPGDKGARVGLTAGIGANVPQNDLLSFQAEVLFSSQGFSVHEDGNTDIDGRYSLNYLKLPILAQATFGDRDLSFYGNGGLSIGYLLGGRARGRWDVFNVLRDNINEPLEFTDEPNPFRIHEVDANRIDVGLLLGGGVNFSVGHLPLFVDLRYNIGLTDYDKNRISKHRTFALTLGARIIN